eukprot:TRINITY_DN12764_c0_g1_i1.p1 TRINITY_DN12764_c0_g1~~TRINITY_DN12764_c0_g1_i1.p1  ORF type:complete len:245 (+),score=50.33 TRINITY_DN12764_c0_g1_i1:119-853(+)
MCSTPPRPTPAYSSRGSPERPGMSTPPKRREASDLSPPRLLRYDRSKAQMGQALQVDSVVAVAKVLDMDALAALKPIIDHLGDEAPLVRAASLGCSPEVLQTLLDHGALADCSCAGGRSERTPLIALAEGSIRPFFFVSSSASDEEIRQRDEERRMAAARCLLNAGADADRLDPQGCTAADYAEQRGRQRLAELLRSEHARRTSAIVQGMWKRHAARAANEQSHSFLDLTELAQQHVRHFLCVP